MTELMVGHFDGPQPYASDNTGDHTGHLGQVATEIGSPAFRAGKFGKGLDISPGNYITYASQLVEAAGSVSFWFNPDDLFSGAVRIVFDDVSSAIDISTNGGEWSVQIGDFSTSTSGETIVTGTWYHLALTWLDGACAFYLNGDLLLSGTKTTWGVGATVNIGNIIGKGGDGAVDELIICDHAPSAAAIRSYYNDGVIRLIGENESINLLDPDGFFIEQGGWRPRVATADELGDYTDEIESMRLFWNVDNDDERAPQIQAMERIFANARRRDPRNDPNSFVPAYLEVRGHSESEMRYAIVRDGGVRELDPLHWSAVQPVDASLMLTREGAWRAVLPRANGVPWPVVVAEAYHNKDDADGNNEITILAEDVPGDAEALMDITMNSTDPIKDGILAKRVGHLDYLNAFQSHFNVADKSATDGTESTNTDAPGDKEHKNLSATSLSTQWLLSASDMHGYVGRFSAYVLGWTDVQHDDTVVEVYMISTGDITDVPERFSATPYTPWIFNKEFGLPQGAVIPGIDYYSTFELRTLHVKFTVGGGNDVFLWSISLIPMDYGVLSWSGAIEDNVRISGRMRVAYDFNTGSGSEITTYRLGVHGNFLTLSSNENTRLYIYNLRSAPNFKEMKPNISGTVTIEIVPRYLALRGIT